MVISVTQLKANPGKYLDLAGGQDIYITRRGQRIARLVSDVDDRVAAVSSLFGVLPSDIDLDRAKTERLGV